MVACVRVICGNISRDPTDGDAWSATTRLKKIISLVGCRERFSVLRYESTHSERLCECVNQNSDTSISMADV